MVVRRALVVAASLATCAVAAPAAFAAPSVSLQADAKGKVGSEVRFTVKAKGTPGLAAFEGRVLVNGKAVELAGAAVRTGKGVSTLGPTETAQGLFLGFYGARITAKDTRLAEFAYRPTKQGRITVRLVDVVLVDTKGRRIAVGNASTVVQVGASRQVWNVAATSRRGNAVSPDAPLADVTEDGVVDGADVMDVVYAIANAREAAQRTCGVDAAADVNRDGCIDVADAQAALAKLGTGSRPKSLKVGEFTFVVNTTSDLDDATPGNGICATIEGVCSLRAAVNEANRHAGLDFINFNIPGPGPHTIRVLTNFPTISDRTGGVVIDGYTQPGASPNTDPVLSNAVLQVQIQGPMPNARGNDIARVNGPFITSPNNTIRGLSIFGFYRMLWISGAAAQNNRIVGNWIGIGATPLNWTPAPRSLYTNGGLMIDSASRNIIGSPALADRNVLSGTYGSGVYLTHTGSDYNVIQNNIIGLAPNGLLAVRNHSHGVDLNFGSKHNLIGGTGANERNVIGGNIETGIELSHGYDSALPAGQDHSEPFVIRDTQIIGNYLGLLPDGTATTYSRNTGDSRREGAIHMEDWIYDTVIRSNYMVHSMGPSVRMGNHSDGGIVELNHIGYGPNGEAAVAQDWGFGLDGGSSGNTIRFNDLRNTPGGVWIQGASVRNRISQNAMHGLTDLGIDLNRDGVTLGNASGSGANGTIYLPTNLAATTTQVTGQTTNCAGCTVEVFKSSGVAGGYGPGGDYLGSATAGANNRFTFAVPAGALVAGDLVTANVTTATGNTSEFALNVAVGSAPPADAPVADDAFTRIVNGGWGSAPTGGAYSVLQTAADYAVDGEGGTMRMAAGATREAWLGAVSLRDLDSRVTFSTDKPAVGGNLWVYVVGRRTAAGSYRANIRMATNGQVFAQVTKAAPSAEVGVGAAQLVPGVTHTAGARINVRLRVSGVNPTTISIAVWADGQPEPAPQVTRTDSEPALQSAGSPGLRAYTGSAATNAPVVARFDDWLVRPIVP